MFHEIKELIKETHVGKGWAIQKEEKNTLVLEEVQKTTATATFTHCPEILTYIQQQGISIEGCIYRYEIQKNHVKDRIGYFIQMEREGGTIRFDLLVQDQGVIQKRRAKIYKEDRSQLVQKDLLHQIELVLIDYVQELPEFRLHFATGNVR